MSQYTTELHYLPENGFDLQLNEYPIFDEAYRGVLNKKILDHYWFREIGFETPARFRHYLKARMNEIMPYYNELYRSTLLTFDPLIDMERTENSTKTTDGSTSMTSNNQMSGTNNQDSTAESIDLVVESDTPQGMLSDIEANAYASNAKRQTGSSEAHQDGASTSTGTATGATTVDNVDDYVRTITGLSGQRSKSKLLAEFRKTIINIDVQVLVDLADLFMGVY